MSYTELEHGYQGLRSATRPIFYVGDINTVQPNFVGPSGSAIYRSSKRAELSDGCNNEDGCMGGSDVEGEGKQVLVGICAMAKKSQSKPMKEILTRLEEFEYIKIVVFSEEVILKESVEDWPIVDCLISFHSKGFPLDKAISYANLRNPFIINNLPMQYDIQNDFCQDRRRVYAILESEGIEIPRYAVLDRDSPDPKHHELVESEDHVEVNGVTFNKPFVEKPVSAEDHNIYIYYPTSAGGGSQRLFRKIGSRSSVYSPESRVRKSGSYIYEDFMPTDGTDVKVYTVGPDYAHAEARKSPALDGKVERDSEGKEIRYPVILSNAEKLISRKVCLAFKQTVCGFDLLRANGQSFVCDVNGFSFVKNSNKYYDDCAKILGNMILRELAPTLHIPWSVPFQLDDPPIVPTTFGKMMELRCVVAVIRHGDRTPKQKMKVEVRHPKFFEIFAKYDGYKHGHVKLKRPKQLQEILDTARSLLAEIQHRAAGPELEEKQGKLEQLKSVLEMYGHFSGINRKVQMKYQPRGRPRGSSSDDDRLGEPSLVLILKWGGELTPAGRIQAEELGRIFRCMYPGGQGRHLSEEDSEMLPNHGEYAGAQGLGLLRLHSTFRHDLKIYASDEGRVQMTAAAFAKGLLALEGELTPILVQMVKSANTNGLLDNDCDSSKYQNMVKNRLHELLQQDREFTQEDREQINPGNALSINAAMDFVKNPVRCCQHVHALIQKLMDIVRIKKDDPKTKDAILYHGETWELMGRRWGKIEKDFCTKNKRFDISKIPDIYDCIKYDLQHNNHTLQFEHAEELYIYAKYLADIVIPQEYGLTVQEKLTIGQGICTPLLKKIRADLQRNIEESGEETVNRLNPRYSHGVSSPGRHVRTRLYFTSESHVHSLLTVLRYGGLLDVMKDEQWRRAMEYVSMVSELNYMSQIVVMLYEDPTKDPSSEERFHVELHFSPGVNCCVQKNLPPGPGFRPHSRNESNQNLGEGSSSGQENVSQCSTRIEEEDAELGILEDEIMRPSLQLDTSPPLVETDTVDSIDSPTTSRAIDMMDLDPNMMDEPFDSGFSQTSAPIPISARTVAGHEAARLGSQLAATQRHRREREAGMICEPRARSYDHQRQEKPEKAADKLQYQSLDAVNKEACASGYESTSATAYLGRPVHLPHTISSPELPVEDRRAIEQHRAVPEPLVTLHHVPLASPGSSFAGPRVLVVGPPHRRDETQQRVGRRARNVPRTSTHVRATCAETILPSIEISGEPEDDRGDDDDEDVDDLGWPDWPCCRSPCDERSSVDGSCPRLDRCACRYRHGSVSPAEDACPAVVDASGVDWRANPDAGLARIKSCNCRSSCEGSSGLEGTSCPNAGIESTVDCRLPVELKFPRPASCTCQSPREKSSGLEDTCLSIEIESNVECRAHVESKLTHPASCACQSPHETTSDLEDTCPNIKIESSLDYRAPVESRLTHPASCTCRPSHEKSFDFEDMCPNVKIESSIDCLAPVDSSVTHLPFCVCDTSHETPSVLRDSFPGANRGSVDASGTRSPNSPTLRPDEPLVLEPQTGPKRSRSLSPCYPVARCLCYNCNVSELILQSRDLPAPERSNFRSYFVRSLSHKFFNCSCYALCSCGCCGFVDSLESGRASRYPSDVASPFVHCRSASLSRVVVVVGGGTGPARRCRCWSPSPERCLSLRPIAADPGRAERRSSFDERRRSPTSGTTRLRGYRSVSCPELRPEDASRRPGRATTSASPPAGRHHRRPRHRHRCCCHHHHHHHHHHHPHHHHNRHDHRHQHHCSRHAPHPKLQPQRSFSSPDTRPSIIQPDPTCTARRHRHSISGQMSYFKLLGYNVSKKLTGSANSLFSTAVISGSSSAPNLKDMVPPHASAVAAIEGFGGVPPIRPLETLHNALSLRQLDSFLEMVTSAPLFRTPTSSPPKYPSPAGSTHEAIGQNLGIGREYQGAEMEAVRYITPNPIHYKSGSDVEAGDIRNQASPTSPNSTGWSSEPQSFLSSEPSSPAPTSTGECSMSISLISNDGNPPFSAGPRVPTTPCLDLDFNEFCANMDQENRESRGSVSYTDYYSNEDGQIRRPGQTSAPESCLSRSTGNEESPADNPDEDDEHTLTLRQAEEQKKQDVKLIFEQRENTAVAKSGSNYKKIGRFRVESMEVQDEDVRIKEPTSSSSLQTTDRTSRKDGSVDKDGSRHTTSTTTTTSTTGGKRRSFGRSQSASTPSAIVSRHEVQCGCKSVTKQSFSSVSDRELESWKASRAETTSGTEPDRPILTVAGSLVDSTNVTIGFNVQEDKGN